LQLAHAVTTAGANVEMLLLAAGLLVLAVVLFVQKSVKAVVPIVLILFAIAAGAGAFALGDQRPHAHSAGTSAGAAPSGLDISVVTPTDGGAIAAGEPVTIEVEVEGGQLVNATTSDDPRDGHLHIYVDGTLASMVSRSTTEVDLAEGMHEIEAEFTTADHRSFDPPVTDTVAVTAE
jgi:hypothetical protein